MGKVLTLADIQSESLLVLKKFDEICEKQNLRYCLAYGTLIGAIRHNGFIPWDDDVDVMMPRDDYNAFIGYCQEHEKEIKPFKLNNRANTLNYPYGIARFSNMNYRYYTENPCLKDFDIGVFIDIYPLDNCGNSEEEASALFDWCQAANREYDWYLNPTSPRGLLPNVAKHLLSFAVKAIRGKQYYLFADKRMENHIREHTSDSDKYVSVPTRQVTRVVFDKEIILNTEKHLFQGAYFNIPVGYDCILRQLYGDYMILPPEEQRHGTHGYRIEER